MRPKLEKIYNKKNLIKYKTSQSIDRDKILFFGSANLADISWCELYTYNKSKENELKLTG